MRFHLRLSPLFCAALLALCQFVLVLPLIGVFPIGGSSEAREAHIANIILQNGEWLLPLRDGLVPSKPPLFHWIAAGFAMFSGQVTPFVARLVSLMFGSGVICLTALMVVILCQNGSASMRRDKNMLALGAAVILATTFGFQNMTGDARVDMTYCFFVCLSLFPMLTACTSESASGISLAELKRTWRWNLFFAAMACGVLAKGPIAIVLPVLIVFFVFWSTLGLRETLRQTFRPRLAWIVFFLIATPWYVVAMQRGGDDFLERQLFFENFQRFTGGAQVNTQPWWYYVPAFLRTALPWSLLLIAAIPETVSFFRRSRALGQPYVGARMMRQCFALWFWVGFVFLSLASGKRQSYMLPLFPGMAVFLALRSHQFYAEMSDRNRARLVAAGRVARQVLLGALLLVAACFDVLRFPLVVPSRLYQEIEVFLMPAAFRIEVMLVILAMLVAGAMWFRRASMFLRAFSIYAALLGLTAVIIYSGLAVKNFLKGFDRAAVKIAAAVPADQALIVVREPRFEFFDALLYYMSRPVRLATWQESSALCPAYLVVRLDDFGRLQESGGKYDELLRFNALDRHYANKIDDEYVLARCAGKS